MKVNLAYGKSGHLIELPENMNVDIIEPQWVNGVIDENYAITEALRNPYNSKPLNQIIGKDDKIGIIFSDITRATPYNLIVPAILEELQNIPQKNITFFCANGTHRLATDEELISILGQDVVNQYTIIQNESGKADLFEYVGSTTSGNKISLNKEILKCNIKILTGFIEPHFFAGFSGGIKALIPGMASRDTIKYNHSITHLSERKAVWGITEGNPIWNEMMETVEFVRGLFLLNVSMNNKMEITNVFAGDLRSAHKAGCQFVSESAMVPVEKLYDIVITTNSGYPLDLNIYQTVKGMSAAAQIVKDGGNIIIAAECWDGVPSGSDYETILKSVNSVDELMEFVMKKESSLQDTWQIYCQAMIQKKARVFLYSDRLDDETIKLAHLNPVDNIINQINKLVAETGSDAKICIMPVGPQTIPYLV
jgi:lactate racemase